MVNKKDFLEEFERRFSGFNENCPIKFQYALGELSVDILLLKTNFQLSFNLDFFRSVKENIFEIHKILQKHYPILCEQIIEDVPLTTEDIENLVSEGYSIEDALKETKKIVKNIFYILDKVLTNHNTLVLIEKKDKRNKYSVELQKPAFMIVSELIDDPVDNWIKVKAVEKRWEKIGNL
jgi:hypothetical protein